MVALTVAGEELGLGFAELDEEKHECPDCGATLMVAGEECEGCGWQPPAVHDTLKAQSEREATFDAMEELTGEYN
jgi:hypothetical protein